MAIAWKVLVCKMRIYCRGIRVYIVVTVLKGHLKVTIDTPLHTYLIHWELQLLISCCIALCSSYIVTGLIILLSAFNTFSDTDESPFLWNSCTPSQVTTNIQVPLKLTALVSLLINMDTLSNCSFATVASSSKVEFSRYWTTYVAELKTIAGHWTRSSQKCNFDQCPSWLVILTNQQCYWLLDCKSYYINWDSLFSCSMQESTCGGP